MNGNGTPTQLTPATVGKGLSRFRTQAAGAVSAVDPYPRVRLVHLLAPLKTAVPLALTDQVAAWCCVACGFLSAAFSGTPLASGAGAALAAAVSAAVLVGFWAFGLYPGVGVNPVNETRQTVIAASAVFAVATVTLPIGQPPPGAVTVLAFSWLASLVVFPAGRMTARSILSRFRWWRRPVVVLGSSENAQRVAARLRRWRTLGLEPIGNLCDVQREGGQSPAEPHARIGLQQVSELIERRGIHWAILALPERNPEDQTELLANAFLFPHVLIVDEASTLPSLWSRTVDIDGCSGRHSYHLFGIVPRQLKRCMDVIVAGLLMLILAPPLLMIGALIKVSSPGPVLFAQERVGRGGRPFRAWKFRTMVTNADAVLANYLQAHPELRKEWQDQHKLKKDPRIIPGIGHFLRYYSLDELPQLWNVLCGEMSLVGPRPIVEEEIPKYQDDFSLYIQVSPGLTGLWQISGRNNTTYQRRVFLDGYYIRNWSPWLDYYILLRTIKTVALREGAY